MQKKRNDPHHPTKPIAQSILFPVGLAVAFTLLVDAYRGIVYYQLIMFSVVAALLFWMLYIKK
ncbi:MAG: hypothetical protein GX133_01765 [Syntrophomonadaceae bacterium]|nr:hypothetical protein [Syntrophomonadaceae bacterium]